ncbi:MAG: MFS transporter, partial [Planctomycetaceae bacterium]
RARYMGLFQMSYAVSIALGAPLGGVILTHFGGAGLWGGSAALLILAGLALIPLHQRLNRRSSETREQDLLLGSADS